VIADSQAISLSSTGTGDLGATGTSFASASLADGYLKASVSTNSISAQGNLIEIGQANVRIGLSAAIDLSGPSDVGGVVAVTMTFDGTYGGAGDNASFFQLASGPGFDGIKVARADEVIE